MKKKILAIVLSVFMMLAVIPIASFAAPELEAGQFGIKKTVTDSVESIDVTSDIAEWIAENYDGDADALLSDISFELYHSNENGDELGYVANGTIGADSMIVFSANTDSGWYLIREVLGNIADDVFDLADDFLVYFDARTGLAYGKATDSVPFSADTAFTITQYKSQSRPLQALYRDEEGKVRYLRNAPSLNVINRPNNGGGALTTSRFTSTADNGEAYMSFCADIGAIGVKGTYFVDESNHGLSEDEVLKLVAAIDYIYNTHGFEDYEGIALAQLVVWNMVLQYSDDPMIADLWVRTIAESIEDSLLYKTAWGELIKIEGYNNSNGTNYWYTPEYQALINGILENPDNYVDIYNASIRSGERDSFVSGAVFLKGDGNYANYYQQRQVLILFGDAPVSFNNLKKATPDGNISIQKEVSVDGELTMGIVDWAVDGYDGDVSELLANITFKLYASDESGSEGEYICDANIDPLDSSVVFQTNVPEGWYLIREELGEIAANVFEQQEDLVIYFDGFESSTGIFVNDPITTDKGALVVEAEVEAYTETRGPKHIGGTLVTYVGESDAVKKGPGGYNAYGDYIDNTQGGFTAIAVDVNGANDRVYDISYSGHGNPKFQEESDKIGLTYTLEVVDGSIVVTFDENFVSTAIAYGVYENIEDINWSPGQYNVSYGHDENDSGVIVIPLPEGAEGTVYLAIHMDGATFNSGDEGEVVRERIDYPGTLTLEITGPNDFFQVIDNYEGSVELTGLDAGEYHIVLSGEGFDSREDTVLVQDGYLTTLDFGTIEAIFVQ